MDETISPSLVDLRSESAVLGAILMTPELLSQARSILVADDFHSPCHRVIWESMLVAESEHGAVDLNGLLGVLKTTGKLNAVGGGQVVVELADFAITSAYFDIHLKLVSEAGAGRRAEAKLRHALHEFRRPHQSVRDAMSAALAHVAAIELGRGERSPRHIGEVADKAFEQLEKLNNGAAKTPTTGFPTLDGDPVRGLEGLVGGFMPGALWVLTADTKGGKTALATQWLQFVAEQGFPSLMFEQEMEDTELFWRMACGAKNIPVTRTRQSRLNQQEMDGLIGVSSRLSHLPLWIEASGLSDVHFIRATIGEQLRRGGARVVMVDYLQILEVTANFARANQAEALGYMTRHLKRTARLFGVTIVLLSQISREAAQGKVRELHGLKGSSSIAQDADVVAVIRRDDNQDEHGVLAGTWEGVIDVVANRNGPLGAVPIRFDGQRMRFEELSTEDIQHAKRLCR